MAEAAGVGLTIWQWLTGGFLVTVVGLLGWFLRQYVLDTNAKFDRLEKSSSGIRSDFKAHEQSMREEVVRVHTAASRFEAEAAQFKNAGLQFQHGVNQELMRFKDQIHDVGKQVTEVGTRVEKVRDIASQLGGQVLACTKAVEKLEGTLLKNEVNIDRVSKAIGMLSVKDKERETQLVKIRDDLHILKTKKPG
jgi:hypothetical protein